MRWIAIGCACAVLACAEARHVEPAASTESCSRCHGSADDAAPPGSLAGALDPSDPRVGAHQRHVRGGSAAGPVACAECHLVPSRVGDPGHMDGERATVTFGPLARSGGARPEYDPATGACAGTYCHGATLRGGAATAPRWTDGPPAPAQRCKTCHGAPPPRPHPLWSACERCHQASQSPSSPRSAAHLDGAVDGRQRVHPAGWIGAHGAAALAGGLCAACHGAFDDAGAPLTCTVCHGPGGSVSCGACHGAPPASGAHAAHHADPGGTPRGGYGDLRVLADYEPAGAERPMYGCGHCHPLEPLKHLDGVVEVDLSPAGAPPGSLKARNAAGAAYTVAAGDPAGRCNGVYCHGSGQDAPATAFAETPRWDEPGPLGCGACHGNPPRYPSGGSGTATANGHLYAYQDGGLALAGGHWGDLPSFGHRDLGHPVASASPVTCQACHYATVDPARTGPSGFYYLDATSDYDLGAGVLTARCDGCHAPGLGAPFQQGKALPLRHVDGRRDVVFDPRTAIAVAPGYARLPAPPNQPRFPYWVRPAGLSPVPGVDMAQDGDTLSMHLASARWDAATKTCSNVACHLSQTSVAWGGTPPLGSACLTCHASIGR